MALETANAQANHTSARVSLNASSCPYCGQPISRKAYREIQSKIDAEVRARIAEAEAGFKSREAGIKAQIEAAARAEIEKVKKSAETAMKQRVQVAEQTAARKIEQANARSFAEKQMLIRRLEARTPQALGNEDELDLLGLMQHEFKLDQIEPVGKGQRGPDLVHTVMYGGTPVGKIVVDCKNVSRFEAKFLDKLRRDQLQAQADFSVLATRAFPAGHSEVALIDGVVLADPRRVPFIAAMMRKTIIDLHITRAGNEDRQGKVEALFRFIVSPAGRDKLDEVTRLTDEIAEMSEKERRTHEQVWRRRAELEEAIRDSKNQFTDTLDALLNGVAVGRNR